MELLVPTELSEGQPLPCGVAVRNPEDRGHWCFDIPFIGVFDIRFIGASIFVSSVLRYSFHRCFDILSSVLRYPFIGASKSFHRCFEIHLQLFSVSKTLTDVGEWNVYGLRDHKQR